MLSGASERRIRNNKIRRRREMRRNLFMCVLTMMLVVSLSLIFFGFGTKAQENDEVIYYKYYTSITVQAGDTLWDYAEQYGDKEHYDSAKDYIKEVIKMNALSNDKITSGQHIILPYYSPEFA